MNLFVMWLLSLATPISSGSRKLTADPAMSVVRYEMHHPMHDWEGISRQIRSVAVYNDATDRLEAAAVSVPVASFDTKNANRDSHAIEILDGIRYPTVTFSSSRITQTGEKLSISGNLTFHGVTKPVAMEAERKDGKDRLTVSGRFSVKMADFGIERPSLMMVPTDETFQVVFTLIYLKKES